MSESLRILIVEDSEDDARLALRELRRGGYEPVSARVESSPAMRAALADHAWDVILSDYVVPGFGGLEALAIAKESGLDLPFILVSNKVSEEMLVEAMRAGAMDFVMKDRIERLGPVVKRELADAAARRGLRQAQFEWKTAFDAVQDAIFIHDAEFRIVRANLAYAALGGLPMSEIIGKLYWEVFPKTGGPLPGCVTARETRRWTEEEIGVAAGETYLSRSFPISDAKGSYLYSLHVLQDVTERNRVRDALEQSERRFRSLLEHASELVAVVDVNGTITYISPSVKRIGGYEVAEVLGKTFIAFVHPKDAPAAVAQYSEIIRDPSVLHKTEFRFRNKDGTWTVLESMAKNALADPLINGVVINSRNVTERRLAEATRAELAALVASSRDAIYGADMNGTVTVWNTGAEQMFGYRASEVVGRPVTILVPANLVDESAKLMQRALRGEPVSDYETVRQHKDGRLIDAAFTVSPIRDASGSAAGLSFVTRDITERKRAEQALRRANRALQTLSAGNETLIHAQDEQQLLRDVCRLLVEVGGFRLAWIVYKEHDDANDMRMVAHFCLTEHESEAVIAAWTNTEYRPTTEAIRTGHPQIVQDILSNRRFDPWHEYIRSRGCAALMALPLREGSAAFGALVICAAEHDAFDAQEVPLLTELADDLAFGILTLRTRTERDNLQQDQLRAVERLKIALIATIGAMALTVEKRDPYTAGHQLRVAELCLAIGRELDFSEDRLEGLRLGATIHDIGKIYVPAEILSRPGRLSAPEFEIIKSHPQVGYDIVKDVKFPWPVTDIILQHHERLDGSGYPQGLKGEQIILEARILAVADVVEAMMSHRPYRPGLGIDAALAQVRREAGTTLDPQVVDACERVFREQAFSFSNA
jgi:PAS domain S-box-containing protein/putative nucleotidyltransferase with HDIG domain